MAVRTLKSTPTKINSLAGRIRNTQSRSLTLRKPIVEPVGEKLTVLSLMSGNTPLGTINARTREEAFRFIRSQKVNLTIGWDKSRNEQIVADFVG